MTAMRYFGHRDRQDMGTDIGTVLTWIETAFAEWSPPPPPVGLAPQRMPVDRQVGDPLLPREYPPPPPDPEIPGDARPTKAVSPAKSDAGARPSKTTASQGSRSGSRAPHGTGTRARRRRRSPNWRRGRNWASPGRPGTADKNDKGGVGCGKGRNDTLSFDGPLFASLIT